MLPEFITESALRYTITVHYSIIQALCSYWGVREWFCTTNKEALKCRTHTLKVCFRYHLCHFSCESTTLVVPKKCAILTQQLPYCLVKTGKSSSLSTIFEVSFGNGHQGEARFRFLGWERMCLLWYNWRRIWGVCMLPTGNSFSHGLEGKGWTKQDDKQGEFQVKGEWEQRGHVQK